MFRQKSAPKISCGSDYQPTISDYPASSKITKIVKIASWATRSVTSEIFNASSSKKTLIISRNSQLRSYKLSDIVDIVLQSLQWQNISTGNMLHHDFKPTANGSVSKLRFSRFSVQGLQKKNEGKSDLSLSKHCTYFLSSIYQKIRSVLFYVRRFSRQRRTL